MIYDDGRDRKQTFQSGFVSYKLKDCTQYLLNVMNCPLKAELYGGKYTEGCFKQKKVTPPPFYKNDQHQNNNSWNHTNDYKHHEQWQIHTLKNKEHK